MSAGPIKAWRDSWQPERVTTSPRTSMHAPGVGMRSFCGRTVAARLITSTVADVTCSACAAALRADGVTS